MNLLDNILFNKIMKKSICQTVSALIIILLFAAGCSSFPENVDTESVNNNRENIPKLTIGNTKSEVIAIMGSPQQTQTYPRYAKHLEYWKYQTSFRSKLQYAFADEHYTFLAFEGNNLVAIGAGHEVIPFNNKHPLWKP